MRSFLNFYALVLLAFFYPSVTMAQVSDGLNFSSLADDLLTPNKSKLSGKIAVYPLDMKESGLTRSAGRAIEDALRNAIQKKAGEIGLTVVARAGLTAVYNDKQFTSKSVDYAELAAKADVDAIVVVSARRLDREQVSVTAKVYGVTGENQGQVLAASNAQNVQIQTKTKVFLEGVFYKGDLKPRFNNAVLSSLSSKPELSMNTEDKSASDFIVRADVEYTISDKESADAQGLKLMGGLFGSITSINGEGQNPLAGFAKGMGNMGKTKQISVRVVAEATDSLSRSKLVSEHVEIKEAPFESTEQQLGELVQSTVRESLKTASDELASKMTGEPVARKKGKKKSALD